MKEGIRLSIIFYATGIGMSVLAYIIDGDHGHGPGLHHIIFLLTFMLGFFWASRTALRYFLHQKTEKRKGIILFNLLMTLIFTVIIYILIQ